MTTPDLPPTPPADTRQQAAEAFKPWEGDHTDLVHVLWAVDRDGLTLHDNFDEVASRIHSSRWLRAYTAAALASSSPALPEPPAPTGRASLGPSDVVMEQLARAFYADYRKQHPGTLTWDTEPEWKRGEMWHLAYVAFSSLAAADVAEEGTR